MKLSIITINRNNAAGLEATMQSVLNQTCCEFQYVIIDGASSDSSIELIRSYADKFGSRLKWISEPDKGIYNAMNKGIRMASGEYVQFLNSGDRLASNGVTEKMYKALENNGYPSILYGNMLKDMPYGILRDRCFAGQDITFLGFYNGTLNHSPAYIRKTLFDKYGFYDESLKIVSDWKWFMQAIVYGNEKPIYVDLDVVRFDMTGISESNKALAEEERKKVLSEIVPASFLADYDQWAFSIGQLKRLKRHPWAYKMVWYIERCLFKMERLSYVRNHPRQWL